MSQYLRAWPLTCSRTNNRTLCIGGGDSAVAKMSRPATATSMLTPPVNIKEWLSENEHLLKPPVGNFCIQRGGATVMIVGGPNQRTDYHINPTPEWFYQYKGPMTLKVVDNGEFKDIQISEGSIFLLPANVPHSPQRYPDTVGIVVEQDRPEKSPDTIRWYCAECKDVVHEITEQMLDLGTQVKDAIVAFENNLDARTCKCGHVNASRYETKAAPIVA